MRSRSRPSCSGTRKSRSSPSGRNGSRSSSDSRAERLEVDAELSLAAKVFATQKHRQKAVRFIDSIATDLGL